jgi:hypothetical protein
MLNSPSADELVGAVLVVDAEEGGVIGAGVSGGVGSWGRICPEYEAAVAQIGAAGGSEV